MVANIVDLAGSENVKESGVENQQLKESCYINKSLYCLTNIVKQVYQN